MAVRWVVLGRETGMPFVRRPIPPPPTTTTTGASMIAAKPPPRWDLCWRRRKSGAWRT